MSAVDRPNILLIHTDQHRFDCLGAYGNSDIRTPHIDALAADGTRYANSFCPFPVCTPSRYSLLSSQYVHQHLGWTNHCTLPAGIPTFPRILREGGYRTKAVGKMHFTPTYLDVGFDEMVLAEQDGPGRYDDDYHRWLRAEGLPDRLDLLDQVQEYRQSAPPEYWHTFGALRSDLDVAHHSTTWIAERAVETLRQWGPGGNLLMVGFIKPHHPFDPPAPWDSVVDPDSLTLLPGWLDTPLPRDIARHAGYFPHTKLTEPALRRVMAFYYASISQIDYQVGRMIDLLRQKGLYDSTLIVFTSDHGDYMGFHHLLLKGNYMYDPVVKVPLIVKLPGQHGQGGVSEVLVSNLDVAPTLLQIAGCDIPASMQGHSLLAGTSGRACIFAENWAGQEIMVRTPDAKLLLCRDSRQSLFFDLQADPFELNNLIDDPAYQGLIHELQAELLRWAVFDAPSRAHLDPVAPVISGSNVPVRGDGHDTDAAAYFRDQMARPLHLST